MENLHVIMFLKRIFPVNCYLVEENHDLTLIDVALSYSAKKIIKKVEIIGKPIKRIVLTHAHDDHIGSLDTLKQLLPNANVYISNRDAKLLAGNLSLEADEPSTPIRGGIPKNVQTKPDFLVQDGDQIGSLLAVSTPGHTPGSMSFLDTRTNAIIAGDAFQTRGGTAVSGQLKWRFPFPALATWNKDIALENARKIEKLNPTFLSVGHGKPIVKPYQQIRQAIEQAEMNIRKLGIRQAFKRMP